MTNTVDLRPGTTWTAAFDFGDLRPERSVAGVRGAVPLFRQVFALTTGLIMDDGSARLPVYPVRVRGGLVEIGRAG